MINTYTLWHIIPVDLGVDFYNPTASSLVADESLYEIVNHPEMIADEKLYASGDYKSLKNIWSFLARLKANIKSSDNPDIYKSVFSEKYPGVTGCISKIIINDKLACYIQLNGTAVFYERGEKIDVENEEYFSLPVYYERQLYEDDYCTNTETTPRKKNVYEFLNLLWESAGKFGTRFSAGKNFRNNGISYALCVTVVDCPDFSTKNMNDTMKKNIRALVETSAFNNIRTESQWDAIQKKVEEDNFSDLTYIELSENMIFSDNWSGVVLAGDLSKNKVVVEWLMEFEIHLQSMWLLLDAYSENIIRNDYSPVELQHLLNVFDFEMGKLNNDITSSMEQVRHKMRDSLIVTSDINVVYRHLTAMLESRLKLSQMIERKKKAGFSLLADIALMILAILQVYDVVDSIVSKTTFGKSDLLTILIILFGCFICSWFLIKGKSD